MDEGCLDEHEVIMDIRFEHERSGAEHGNLIMWVSIQS